MDWQPIETAPKDGTMFLCWVKAVRFGEDDEGNQREEDCSQVEFCAWYMLEQSPDGGYYDSFCGNIGDHQVITHWMPLPPPPKAEL